MGANIVPLPRWQDAEIRAYYHGGPKNRQGNLLGFDHAGRGHRTLDA